MTKRIVNVLLGSTLCVSLSAFTYPIVDTGVHAFYSNNAIITAPAEGAAFFGQDATYQGNEPSYTDNGNGTITDNATGLMWQQADDGVVRDWQNSLTNAETLVLAGHSDWRLPNAKELQSIVVTILITFR